MSDDLLPSSDGRDPTGRFAPGNGHGQGRRVGSRPAALADLDAVGAERAADIIRAMSTRAAEGDPAAAELVLRRVWPPRRSRPISLDLPEINSPADALAALARLTAAVSAGDVDPDAAKALAEIIGRQHSALEMQALADRIAALEAGGSVA